MRKEIDLCATEEQAEIKRDELVQSEQFWDCPCSRPAETKTVPSFIRDETLLRLITFKAPEYTEDKQIVDRLLSNLTGFETKLYGVCPAYSSAQSFPQRLIKEYEVAQAYSKPPNFRCKAHEESAFVYAQQISRRKVREYETARILQEAKLKGPIL